jgi:Zn finger protein HypA/HybF involved in hydrogenase expression
MHEAGVADRILDAVVEQARLAGDRRITDVHLEAGTSSSVSEESLRFHWEQHSVGTRAEGAVLHLVLVEAPTDLCLVAIDVADD